MMCRGWRTMASFVRGRSACSVRLLSARGYALAHAPVTRAARLHAFGSQGSIGRALCSGAPSPQGQGTAPPSSSPAQPKAGTAGPRRRTPIGWVSLGLTACSAAVLYAIYRAQLERKLRSQKVVGTASLGGPFTLTASTGERVTEQDLKGSWSILYFGFTKCPDICPDELDKLTDVVNRLDSSGRVRGPPLQPVFISIDPDRDTPDRLKAYLAETKFHPRLHGLTGTHEEVAAVARAYRIYYSKPLPEEVKRGDYLLDHSIIMYLLDPEGQFVAFYGKNFTAPEVAEKALAEMDKWYADRQTSPWDKVMEWGSEIMGSLQRN
mmetsp:Transcript_2079/g.5862  ORF Transcript_2079/g.5862 Transcript_2079/m.5862 type:complete len:322 (+) Transcript_2079:3-968(+)